MAGARGAANGGRKGASVAGASEATESALTAAVRRTLKAKVLELRHLLEARRGPGQPVEGDFRRQLAAAGVDERGVNSLPAGQILNDEQRRVREVAAAVIEHEQQNGSSPAEAYAYFLRESAYTFLNHIIGLRCLEARGHLVVQGQTETAVWQQDELGGVPSLYWRLKNTLPPTTPPRELWRVVYRSACEAVSPDIRVLFDPQSEFAALFPLLPSIQQVVAAFNDPAIPPEAYAEDALLGWVYQYFQSEEKDQIFEAARTKRQKIAGPDIIPVTQLYTEQYMVEFLLQNSLGRAWMEMYSDSEVKSTWSYYVTPATPHTRSPKPLKDWAILDPCVGSGHFLVVAFDLLLQLYAEERKFAEIGRIPWEWAVPAEEVAHTILERNLYGIDIDRRAVQLATLALYLKGKEVGLSQAPRINLVAANASFLHGEVWQRFLKGLEREPSVRRVLEAMAGYLKDIRELGSLLQPEKELKRLIEEEHRKWEAQSKPQQDALFPEYQPPKQGILAFEKITDEEFWERLASRAESAIQGFLDAARDQGHIADQVVAGEAQRGFSFLELCQRSYDIVCTNPPYMGSGNMGTVLKSFIAKYYVLGKADLYAAFILRCWELGQEDGYLAMVTQQSWMFLRNFVELRIPTKENVRHLKENFPGILLGTNLETLAHLGTNAFSEISGEVVNIVLFTLRKAPLEDKHKLRAIRLVGSGNGVDKGRMLLQQLNNDSVCHEVLQQGFEKIPLAPIAYWVPNGLLSCFAWPTRIWDCAEVLEGLHSSSSERFVRFFWEVIDRTRWFDYVKGGGYRKWFGNGHYVVDWEDDGRRIRETGAAIIPSSGRYFKPGWTYSLIAGGSFSLRQMRDAIFTDAGPAVFSEKSPDVIPYMNTHLFSYFLRTVAPAMRFNKGYVESAPYFQAGILPQVLEAAVVWKRYLVDKELVERSFAVIPLQNMGSLQAANINHLICSEAVCSLLHSLEGFIEHRVLVAASLEQSDVKAVMDETGIPTGWHPLILGYDTLPKLPGELAPLPEGLETHLINHDRLSPSPDQLVRIKDRLRSLYVTGPGSKLQDEDEESGESPVELISTEVSSVPVGTNIPIPTETFIEEISMKMSLHPISVYWLLEEMRREEGLVCPPELRRQMEDYASVTVLRQLGFRWPEQDAQEREHGPIMDPALVTGDGILPLVRCGKEPTASERLHLRLEHDFGQEDAARSKSEFRQWVGRPLDEWLEREFFKRHIQQFKQRPIAWHFISPRRTFEAFVLYHQLCDEASGRATLQRLRTQYAGGLIERLRAEQDRARANKDERAVTKLQLDIEDVEDFRAKLEAIERGDMLAHRIRCSWKGDEAKVGRPGPYSPDINDGVKVNIRPFQEAGLLAAPVIKKWD